MKLRLRRLYLGDLFSLTRALSHPEVSSKVVYRFKNPFLQALEEIFKRKNTYKFAIIADGKFAGIVALENPNKEKTEYQIGYFTAREFWNKGIASYGVKEIIKFARNISTIKKLYSDNDISNPSSGRVVQKAGFKKLKINKAKGIVIWEKGLK